MIGDLHGIHTAIIPGNRRNDALIVRCGVNRLDGASERRLAEPTNPIRDPLAPWRVHNQRDSDAVRSSLGDVKIATALRQRILDMAPNRDAAQAPLVTDAAALDNYQDTPGWGSGGTW